jgi:peptide/nickel transport system permease protein
MAVAELESEALLTGTPESQARVIWRRFRKHKLALICLGLLVFVFAVAILAPVLAPYDPILDQNMKNKNAPPSAEHVLGTDVLGRDIFSRLLYGARISLTVAFVVVFITEIIGAFVGAISGYYGGRTDNAIQRFVEFMLSLPLLPVLLVVSSILRGVKIPGIPGQWSTVIIVIVVLCIFGWMSPTRQARGMVLSLRSQEFTEASQALGMSDFRIITRHMLPNALPPLIVDATLALGGVIILESALSFLGFGIALPVPTWGNMLQEYQQDMWMNPLKVIVPGLTIFFVTLSFNFVGDGLRDAVDPRLKR